MSIGSKYLGLDSEIAARESGCRVCLKDEQTGKFYAFPEPSNEESECKYVVGRKDDFDAGNYVPIETEDECISRRCIYIELKHNILGQTEVYVMCHEDKNENYVFLQGCRLNDDKPHQNDNKLQMLNNDVITMGQDSNFTLIYLVE